MFENAIVDQNPHWEGTYYKEGVPRKILVKVKDYLELPHIIAVTGVRRSGKSTLIKQIINFLIREKKVRPGNILFLNLENPQFSQYKNDIAYLDRIYGEYIKLISPEGLIYCMLDEVHFFPEWQVFVKSRYEKGHIKFIVTGSNSRLLSSELVTLLSGRTVPVEVFPFSFVEYLASMDIDATDAVSFIKERHRVRKIFDEYLQLGGFPEIAFISEPMMKKEILVMYARAILYQDIAPRFGIKKAGDLEHLFFYLISNVASLYTYNSLSKLLSLSDKTIKEYLAYFEDAFLLFTVNAFDFSVKKQINSPKKVYAIDTGLANAVSFNFSENMGHLLENLVFLKLKQENKEVFYYKTNNGGEVDFIYRESGGNQGLIQVTKEIRTENVRKRETKALVRAMEETGITQGIIVTYEDEEKIQIDGKTIEVVPAYAFLSVKP